MRFRGGVWSLEMMEGGKDGTLEILSSFFFLSTFLQAQTKLPDLLTPVVRGLTPESTWIWSPQHSLELSVCVTLFSCIGDRWGRCLFPRRLRRHHSRGTQQFSQAPTSGRFLSSYNIWDRSPTGQERTPFTRSQKGRRVRALFAKRFLANQPNWREFNDEVVTEPV